MKTEKTKRHLSFDSRENVSKNQLFIRMVAFEGVNINFGKRPKKGLLITCVFFVSIQYSSPIRRSAAITTHAPVCDIGQMTRRAAMNCPIEVVSRIRRPEVEAVIDFCDRFCD